MKVIEVSSRKGGVGTSTVATAIATTLSKSQPDSVLLIDTSENADIWAILGLYSPTLPTDHTIVGGHGLTVARSSRETIYPTTLNSVLSYDVVVIDIGTSAPSESYFGVTPSRVSVVANSYLSLRALTLPSKHYPKPDSVVCVFNSECVLTQRDVTDVVGGPITIVPIDYAVARAIDAGLYDSRERLYISWVNEVLGDLGISETARVK